MKKYEKYKKSGVEWLGEIPEHWEILPGLSFIYENKDRNKGMIRNTVLSLSYGKIRVKGENELTGLVPESFETYQFVNKGDLIFRPTDLQNDTVSLRSSISEYEGIITNAYLNLRFRPKANSKFYHYFFRSIDNNKIIYGLGSGLRQNISYLDFRRFQFPFPPLQEQTAIAHFLDDKTVKIDQAIAIKQNQIELLKERRQILIHKAVTRGLNDAVKLKDSGVEWIGEIPEHWELSPLRHLGKTQNGISKGGESFGTGFPFVSYGDVYKDVKLPDLVNGLVESTIEDRKQYSVLEGDILFTRTSETVEEIGFSSTCLQTIKNATFAGFLIRFRPQKNRLHKEFSKYYFSSKTHRAFFVKEMNLVIRASLSQDLLKRMPVLLPPLSEQEEIGNYLNNATTKIATAISLKEREIERLKEYKMSLIDGVVTGKVRVS
jgi:type I restriction enzyme, S subunit